MGKKLINEFNVNILLFLLIILNVFKIIDLKIILLQKKEFDINANKTDWNEINSNVLNATIII